MRDLIPIESYKAKTNSKRTKGDIIADKIVSVAGTMYFFIAHLLLFIVWFIINSGIIKILPRFDPPPFILLTTIISVEATFLTIIILISQNRADKVAEIREEIDLNTNKVAEEKITVLAEMLSLLLQKNNINIDDYPDIKKVLRPLDLEEVEEVLEEELK